MLNVIMHGCGGAMGKVVCDLLQQDKECRLVAGVDISPTGKENFPVYTGIEDVREEADIIIDFAHVSAVDALLDYTARKNLRLVLCTTGLSDEQLAKVEALSRKRAVLRGANMSLGVNLLQALVKEAAKLLYRADFDIEIIEKHHRRKLDAPSGTALLLADAVNEALGGELSYVYERQSRHKPRDKRELGISALRGGSIVGEHEVIFAGEEEVLCLSHSAYSRSVFAKGALAAAKYLAAKDKGLYTMSDVIAGR